MSTRLNDSSRQAFVLAVLQDTPQIDYKAKRSKVIQDHLFDIAPPEVLKLYKNQATRIYFTPDNVTYGEQYRWGVGKFWLVPDLDGGSSTYRIKDAEVLANLAAIDEADELQRQQRDNLEAKLRGVIKGFNTAKQAKAALPEFAKYLPNDEEKTPQYVPAINDLVTDLVKAGWPDGGKPKETVCS